jgi:hypothetical protein
MKTKLITCIFLFIFSGIVSNSFAQEIPAANCNESVFKPCVCAKDTPPEIQYRPTLGRCGGNAAVILKDEWSSAFSVVFRDRLNRDRFPTSGYNGCTLAQASGIAPPNRCSAYKCQRTIRNRKTNTYICCFGDKGTSQILSKVSRLTIKLKDVPGSSADPLVRVCLNGFSAKNKLN